MSGHSGQPSRYDTTGNPETEYADRALTVLRNKLGITDLHTLQLAEESALAQAYERLLKEVRTATPLTCELLRYVHDVIFHDLFEWAGRWRTVWISKPGITWPPPDFLDESMQTFQREVLQRFPADQLHSDEEFCRAVGQIQGEFLVIHPFREGNARTIKLVASLLAAQTGRPLLAYDKTEAAAYIAAAKAAFGKDYAPMTEIIRQALEQGRRLP